MKQLIKNTLKSLLLVPAVVFGVSFLAPVAVSAITPAECTPTATKVPSFTTGAECAQGTDQPTELFGQGGIFSTIVNIILFVIGAVAVIMLVIGGFRYVVSGGDQAAVTSAKNTILYAIIGLIVAVLAYAAVNFVITGINAAT